MSLSYSQPHHCFLFFLIIFLIQKKKKNLQIDVTMNDWRDMSVYSVLDFTIVCGLLGLLTQLSDKLSIGLLCSVRDE